jgi:hypothetical protein
LMAAAFVIPEALPEARMWLAESTRLNCCLRKKTICCHMSCAVIA